MEKMNIGIFFGGQSTEHDISILSAMQIINSINTNKYNIFPVYISKEGQWFFNKNFNNATIFKNFNEKKHKKVFLKPFSTNLFQDGLIVKKVCTLDCAVVVMHGHGGEDGCLQGLFELNGLPYTSGDVLCLASTLNKDFMKQIFKNNNFPIVNYLKINKNQVEDLISSVTYPAIVKPNSLGSSIGIALCENEEELNLSLQTAFQFDDTVLVEDAIVNLTEYNCAAIGYKDKIVISKIERPLTNNEILSFEDKYLSKNKQKNCSITKRECPAKISDKLREQIEELTKRAFEVFNCAGIVRCDFLYDGKTLYINEINTIPGSLAFYLFDKKITSLIDNLIDFAIQKSNNQKKLIRSFNSSVL